MRKKVACVVFSTENKVNEYNDNGNILFRQQNSQGTFEQMQTKDIPLEGQT